tara:strand:- start:3391 stop:4329 length:939 start_codon:yes stop_codon:yes gene_type:complete
MRTQFFWSVLFLVVFGLPSTELVAGPVQGEEFNPPRTAWGHPDLQGVWTSNAVMGVPAERPKEVLTEEDIARRDRAEAIRMEQEPNRDVNIVWDEPVTERQIRPPSLVIDPPDGRIPVTAEMQEAADEWSVSKYGIGIESWADLDLWDRCITKGFPTVMAPMGYNNAYEIMQTEDFVIIRYEIIHDMRIIPLDGRAPVNEAIKQYWGDSRGRWEGDTLVVEVTNFSNKTFGTQQPLGSYRGGGEGMRVVERFTLTDHETIDYQATIEDSRGFTRPWTLAIPLIRDDSYVIYEYACHEGNYGMEHILSAAFKE